MSLRRTTLITAAAIALWWPLPATGARMRVQTTAPAPGSPAPALPGEWMYPRSSRDVLAAVRATLGAARLKLQHEDRAVGALVTKPVPYDATQWLDAAALGLPLGHTPALVQFHIHVSPDLEPARIAVGAVLDTTSVQTPVTGAKARGGSRFYSVRPLGASFVAALSARLGVAPEPLASTRGGRAAQALRLLPAGLEGGCGVKPPSPEGEGRVEQMPKKANYELLPLYPEAQQRRGAGGQIAIAAELTEHGTVTNMTVGTDQIGDDNLKAAALGAGGLWRYKSAVVGGCPVPISLVLGIQFSMER